MIHEVNNKKSFLYELSRNIAISAPISRPRPPYLGYH